MSEGPEEDKTNACAKHHASGQRNRGWISSIRGGCAVRWCSIQSNAHRLL